MKLAFLSLAFVIGSAAQAGWGANQPYDNAGNGGMNVTVTRNGFTSSRFVPYDRPGVNYQTNYYTGTTYQTNHYYGPAYTTQNYYGSGGTTINVYGSGNVTVNRYGTGRVRVNQR